MIEKFRIIEDKKFAWDGIEYETEDEARSVEKEYLDKEFEVRLITEGEIFFLYTRRVVTEIVLNDQP